MAWYHQFQYAEIKNPLYPTLRGKSLPIVSYEITDNPKKIKAVKVMVARENYVWFDCSSVTLFKSGIDLAIMPELRHKENILKRIMRNMGMK